jgi:hypothetical protein
MFTKSTAPSRVHNVQWLQSRHSRGPVSETWPPHVVDAVVELLSEMLVREYQSTTSSTSATDLTLLQDQRHRPIPQEAVKA